MTDIARSCALVALALTGRRLPVDTEARLQAEIETAMAEVQITFEREAILDRRSRIDFLTGDGVGIEAKIGGGRREVWRQLQRYAAHERIRGLVLIGTVSMPAGLTEILGKPFRLISIGRSWL